MICNWKKVGHVQDSLPGTLHSYRNMAFNFFDINSEQRFGIEIKMAPKGDNNFCEPKSLMILTILYFSI